MHISKAPQQETLESYIILKVTCKSNFQMISRTASGGTGLFVDCFCMTSLELGSKCTHSKLMTRSSASCSVLAQVLVVRGLPRE